MNQDLIIVQTTVNQNEIAESLARKVIESQLAACAQIEGPIQSIYRWKQQIQSEQEWRINFKTIPSLLSQLETLIHQLHPYEIPEIIVFETNHVSKEYHQWVLSSMNRLSGQEV